MTQVKNICINTSNLSETQVKNVDSWLNSLKNSFNNSSDVFYLEYQDAEPYWTLDRDGDRGKFGSLYEIRDSIFSSNVEEVSYEELSRIFMENLDSDGSFTKDLTDTKKFRVTISGEEGTDMLFEKGLEFSTEEEANTFFLDLVKTVLKGDKQ